MPKRIPLSTFSETVLITFQKVEKGFKMCRRSGLKIRFKWMIYAVKPRGF